MTGYRYRVVRERVNLEFRPIDFVSRARLRKGQPIAIDRESWIIRKIDPEGAGPNYDGFVWAVEPEPPGESGGMTTDTDRERGSGSSTAGSS